jgi:hypothetical protein
LEITANSRKYQAALKALQQGDLARAHNLLTGAGDSLYNEIVEKVGAHAGLNFKTAIDQIFERTSKKVFE